MIFGYAIMQPRIQCDLDTDYQEIARSGLKRIRLFLNEKERDESAEKVRYDSRYDLEAEKFITKSNQGKLKIISYKQYYEMVQRIRQLEEELSKYKSNEQ